MFNYLRYRVGFEGGAVATASPAGEKSQQRFIRWRILPTLWIRTRSHDGPESIEGLWSDKNSITLDLSIFWV